MYNGTLQHKRESLKLEKSKSKSKALSKAKDHSSGFAKTKYGTINGNDYKG